MDGKTERNKRKTKMDYNGGARKGFRTALGTSKDKKDIWKCYWGIRMRFSLIIFKRPGFEASFCLFPGLFCTCYPLLRLEAHRWCARVMNRGLLHLFRWQRLQIIMMEPDGAGAEELGKHLLCLVMRGWRCISQDIRCTALFLPFKMCEQLSVRSESAHTGNPQRAPRNA